MKLRSRNEVYVDTAHRPVAKSTRSANRLQATYRKDIINQVLPQCSIVQEELETDGGTIVKERGVKVKENVKKGQPVCWYEGKKRIRPKAMQGKNMVPSYKKNDDIYEAEYRRYYNNVHKSFVLFARMGNVILDIDAINPHQYRNTLGRNINHSDRPNLKPVLVAEKKAVEEFLANPEMDCPGVGVVMIALTDISAHSFLRWNYNVKLSEICSGTQSGVVSEKATAMTSLTF